MSNLFEQAGNQPNKQLKFTPLFFDRYFSGIYTQRSVIHDPSDVLTAKYYGGRADALWMGSNIELTNRLTLQRRPGLVPFSTFVYPTAPDYYFPFHLTDGTIRVIVDTGTTGALTLTAVANSSGSTAVYTGTITGGGSNAYVGLIFQVTGFATGGNDGTFTCTASSTTTLTLSNDAAVAESHAASAISSGAVYWDEQNGSAQLLFAKNPGAGQTHMVDSGGILYMGDGVDTRKYTPQNLNLPPGSTSSVWNWGIVGPTNPPTVTAVNTGASSTQWVANTVWSTMGLIYDTTTGTVQQLNSVNATGTNTTQFGTTGLGQPVWPAIGGTVTDGSITWHNFGPIVAWTAGTTYSNATVGGTTANPCIIYDPKTKACYVNLNPSLASGTSGASYPAFKAGAGQDTHDGSVKWRYIGLPGTWQPSTTYVGLGGNNDIGNTITQPVSLMNGLPTTQVVYWMTTPSTGTSAASHTSPQWQTQAGQITSPDGDMEWMSMGSYTWGSATPYFAWFASGSTFSVIKDTNGNFQVCIQSGTSGGSMPTWSTGYGTVTTDNTVIWSCVGTAMTWVAGTQWYLPSSGFSPPSPSSGYGGASVIDSNNNIEFVIDSGKGGATAPSWSTTSGGSLAASSTTDNAATWYNLEPFVGESLSWQTGYAWAYSFKSLAFDDFYAATPLGGGNTPPGITSATSGGLNNFTWNGVPLGSATNAVSTASPAAIINGANSGAVVTVTGLGSTDPQVDTIVIWRSADGGGSAQMFELTEIPAPAPINGIAQPWTFKDFLPDTPTAVGSIVYPGLNQLIPAPIDDANDPPVSTFLPMVYNFQRIWGSDNTFVPFSEGPDIGVGNPDEAFAPADVLPFLAPVIRLVTSNQGLIVFLTDSIQIISGGPLTSSFFSVTLAQSIGLLSYNALDTFAGEIYFFSADNQFRIITPSLNVQNAGFALGDQFANMPSSGVSDASWNPANVYVASHQSGTDNCIFVADGATGWYRLNPRQVPGSYSGPEPIWSPFANITNGCKAVMSVETVPGIKKLLVGATTGGHEILERSQTVFTDNGTQYDAYFTMGAITLAHPGQLAILRFIEFDFSGVTFKPTVSYLLDEFSGSYTSWTTTSYVFDPPSLYGTTLSPATYSPNRYYFESNPSLARCRFLLVKVDFGTTAVGDEVNTMTIYGRVFGEL